MALLCIFPFFPFVHFFTKYFHDTEENYTGKLTKSVRNYVLFLFLFSLFHSIIPAFLPLENHKLLSYTVCTLQSLADGFENPSYSKGTSKIIFSTAEVIKKDLSFCIDSFLLNMNEQK